MDESEIRSVSVNVHLDRQNTGIAAVRLMCICHTGVVSCGFSCLKIPCSSIL